ncbi:glutamine--fructose-6-phosphate transaminase (isomerizing) [Candidatus Microgenomates bacterium]|nr:glutamine--fructose-6-phosphate transaminase (isomerizing) [Candidatus Microgenomates bacterium]
MCGIFGYIGSRRDATSAVFEGLKRLDYRGYDSWGVAVLQNKKILLDKHTGTVNKKLSKLPKSSISVGHTRWATHGSVTDTNAHPHFSSDGSFVLAQNGIMENYSSVKQNLFQKNYKFISQTDTEVIVRLIEEELKKEKDIIKATRSAFNKLKGRNTVIILTKDGQIIAVRNGSPLVLGFSKDKKEFYFSSDTLSFSPYVEKTITLDNGQMAIYSKNMLTIKNVKTGKNLPLLKVKNGITQKNEGKGKFNHFMIKEIFDQPSAIEEVIKQDKRKLEKLSKLIKKSKNVYCMGSGTAGAAAFQMAYYLRTYAGVNAIGLIGAECTEYLPLFSKEDLIIAPSQSGETADVLEILEMAKKKGVKVASYVNMPGSLITKISDISFMANAGAEICVMSTKVFISQIAFGYLVAKNTQEKYDQGVINLKILAKEMRKVLNNKDFLSQIKKIAKKLSKKKHIFLLGKGQNLQIIKEGMVKIIEGSYVHAHAIPAGDLKHYAITLMEAGVPIIPVVSNDAVSGDVENAINEIKARGAEIIKLPKLPDTGEVSAILNTVPLQLIAYYMAVYLKNNVDKPRNIAKSVTVK